MATEIQERIEKIVTSGRSFSRGSHISDSDPEYRTYRNIVFHELNREELELLKNQNDLLQCVLGMLDCHDGKLNKDQTNKFDSIWSRIDAASHKLKDEIDYSLHIVTPLYH